MSSPVAILRKRQAILVLRFMLLSVFFGILLYWLQPFSKRYEKKTARDWFSEWMASKRLRAEVVVAFGVEHAKSLIGTIESNQKLSRTLFNISPSLYAKVESALRLGEKNQLAIDWLSVLQHQGHDVVPLLFAAGQTNIIGIVCSYYEQSELEKRIAEEQNPQIKFQMERAIATIEKHGTGQINLLLSDPLGEEAPSNATLRRNRHNR